MTGMAMKVDYTLPDGSVSTAYVHDPEPVTQMEAENGQPLTNWQPITCGTNKHTDEPLALQWDDAEKVWRQLAIPHA